MALGVAPARLEATPEGPPVPLGAAWPRVSQQVRRTLLARGAPPGLLDDLLQETAERAFATRSEWASHALLFSWSLTVAGRLLIDELRRGQRLDRRSVVPEVGASDDTARSALARLDLAAVLAGIAALSSRDRESLTAGPHLDERTRNREYVRRHRLRKALRERLET
jgi:DNA-directed RNA polymerase specialized sigma24 family protein